MGVLCLLGGGCEPSSNGPDGLIGNHNISPVLLGKYVSIGLNLGENKVVGGAGLTALEWFSAARNDLKSLVESVLGLPGDFLIGLTLAPPLRVSNDHPPHTHIRQHVGRRFSSEGSVTLHPAILGTNSDVLPKFLRDTLDINLRRTNNNLGVCREGGLVEHGDKVVHLLDGTIALPVSTNKELASVGARRRMEGPLGGVGCRGGQSTCGSRDHGEELGRVDGGGGTKMRRWEKRA
mmetsp:Transcript_16768/g.34366  ORF Transcript_16768/g.34366 Transcript_16768/m.34366 type:complete len:235 (+) Transcript_16768:1403-2107(+)